MATLKVRFKEASANMAYPAKLQVVPRTLAPPWQWPRMAPADLAAQIQPQLSCVNRLTPCVNRQFPYKSSRTVIGLSA